MERELLTYEEVAAQLRLSEATLRKWVSESRIPHVKLGRSVRFEKTELARWIDSVSKKEHGKRRTI